MKMIKKATHKLISGGPSLDAVPFLTNDEVSPLDETALVTAVENPSNVRLETSRLGPMMTGPTESQDRRGLKLQRLALIHRQIAFIYRQIAFSHREIAFIHQPISIIHHRDREFPRARRGEGSEKASPGKINDFSREPKH